MNARFFFNTGKFALLLALSAPLHIFSQTTQFASQPGSKVRIEGTSSIHDWQIEGNVIGGTLEAGPNFPTDPAQTIQPGKVDAKVSAFITVRSLKSVEKDGKPYSDSMDGITYEKLLQTSYPRIVYRLSELVLKEVPKTAGAPYIFDSQGELAVAGVTNKISMPVNVTLMPDKKVKISGKTSVKMTDFKIQPPAPTLGLGLIKTGDEVKVSFEWIIAQKAAPAAGR